MALNVHLGTIVGSEINTNLDGENNTRILSAELSSAEDVQSIEHICQNGEQTNPLDDATVIILEINKAWKIAIAVKDLVEPDATINRGEKIIYSLDSSNNIKAKIYLKNDGTVNVGNGDQFVALANKVDSFITDIVDLLTGWTPVSQDGGLALQTAAKALWDPSMGGTAPDSVASSNLKADE